MVRNILNDLAEEDASSPVAVLEPKTPLDRMADEDPDFQPTAQTAPAAPAVIPPAAPAAVPAAPKSVGDAAKVNPAMGAAPQPINPAGRGTDPTDLAAVNLQVGNSKVDRFMESFANDPDVKQAELNFRYINQEKDGQPLVRALTVDERRQVGRSAAALKKDRGVSNAISMAVLAEANLPAAESVEDPEQKQRMADAVLTKVFDGADKEKAYSEWIAQKDNAGRPHNQTYVGNRYADLQKTKDEFDAIWDGVKSNQKLKPIATLAKDITSRGAGKWAQRDEDLANRILALDEKGRADLISIVGSYARGINEEDTEGLAHRAGDAALFLADWAFEKDSKAVKSLKSAATSDDPAIAKDAQNKLRDFRTINGIITGAKKPEYSAGDYRRWVEGAAQMVPAIAGTALLTPVVGPVAAGAIVGAAMGAPEATESYDMSIEAGAGKWNAIAGAVAIEAVNTAADMAVLGKLAKPFTGAATAGIKHAWLKLGKDYAFNVALISANTGINTLIQGITENAKKEGVYKESMDDIIRRSAEAAWKSGKDSLGTIALVSLPGARSAYKGIQADRAASARERVRAATAADIGNRVSKQQAENVVQAQRVVSMSMPDLKAEANRLGLPTTEGKKPLSRFQLAERVQAKYDAQSANAPATIGAEQGKPAPITATVVSPTIGRVVPGSGTADGRATIEVTEGGKKTTKEVQLNHSDLESGQWRDGADVTKGMVDGLARRTELEGMSDADLRKTAKDLGVDAPFTSRKTLVASIESAERPNVPEQSPAPDVSTVRAELRTLPRKELVQRGKDVGIKDAAKRSPTDLIRQIADVEVAKAKQVAAEAAKDTQEAPPVSAVEPAPVKAEGPKPDMTEVSDRASDEGRRKMRQAFAPKPDTTAVKAELKALPIEDLKARAEEAGVDPKQAKPALVAQVAKAEVEQAKVEKAKVEAAKPAQEAPSAPIPPVEASKGVQAEQAPPAKAGEAVVSPGEARPVHSGKGLETRYPTPEGGTPTGEKAGGTDFPIFHPREGERPIGSEARWEAKGANEGLPVRVVGYVDEPMQTGRGTMYARRIAVRDLTTGRAMIVGESTLSESKVTPAKAGEAVESAPPAEAKGKEPASMTREELVSRYKPGNPFAEKAAIARDQANRLSKPTAHDAAMAEAFPVGAGYGRKGGEKRLGSTIARAVKATDALNEAKRQETLAEAYDRGEINASGRKPAANAESAAAKREARKKETEAAQAEREGKEPWEVTQDTFLKSSQYRSGNGADLIRGDHRDAVEAALREGKPVPESVLADYPDLKPKEAPPVSAVEPAPVKAEGPKTARDVVKAKGEGSLPPTPSVSETAATEGKGKRLITDEALATAKKNITDKLGGSTLRSDVDPTLIKDLSVVGLYHFENLVRAADGEVVDFVRWSKTVIEEQGDWMRPHLREIWDKTTEGRGRITTGISLARVDEQRANRGLEPVENTEPQTREQWLADAQGRMEIDPTLADRVVTDLIEGKGSPTPGGPRDNISGQVTNAILAQHMTSLSKTYAEANVDHRVAKESGIAADIEKATTALHTVEAELGKVERARKLAGAEQSRALSSGGIVLADDFSLVAGLGRMKEAVGDKPIPDALREQVVTQATEIERLTNELKASKERDLVELEKKDKLWREAKVRSDAADAAVAKAKPNRPSLGSRNRLVPIAEKDAAIGRLLASGWRVNTGLPVDQMADLVKVGLHYAEAGVRQLPLWVNTMTTVLGPKVGPYLDDIRKAVTNELYNKSYGDRTLRRVAQIWEKVASGQGRTERRAYTLSKESQEAAYKLDAAKVAWNGMLLKQEMKNRSLAAKGLSHVREAIGLARITQTSEPGISSVILRQGAFIAMGNPIAGAKAVVETIKAFASDKARFKSEEAIRNDPRYSFWKENGLVINELSGPGIKNVEEYFGIGLIHRMGKIRTPYLGKTVKVITSPLRGAERAALTGANRLRMVMANSLADGVEASQGTPITPEQGKAITHAANIFSGTFKAGKAEATFKMLNELYFAPKLNVSRLAILVGQPMWKADSAVRAEILGKYGRFLVGATTLISMGVLAGGKFTNDRKDKDFGKLVFGKTRIDVFGGALQWFNFARLMIEGDYRTALGDVVPLDDKSTPFSKTRGDVIGRYNRSKINPIASAIWGGITGKDFVGRPTTLASTVQNMTTPMFLNDAIDAAKQYDTFGFGSAIGTIAGAISASGMGISTFDPEEPQQLREGDFWTGKIVDNRGKVIEARLRKEGGKTTPAEKIEVGRAKAEQLEKEAKMSPFAAKVHNVPLERTLNIYDAKASTMNALDKKAITGMVRDKMWRELTKAVADTSEGEELREYRIPHPPGQSPRSPRMLGEKAIKFIESPAFSRAWKIAYQ